jgi:hypothetical protein
MTVFLKNIAKFLSIGGILISTNAFAQIDSLNKSVSILNLIEPRLKSNNPANLFFLPIKSFSTASGTFNKYNGDYINYYESDNSYSYKLSSESFQKLNDKTVVSGGISYLNFNGKNMGGSILIDPYKNPFNILEFDQNNEGEKNLESYKLNGKISHKLLSNFTVGGDINYETANYAKRKDVRHINNLMDLDFSLGAIYSSSNRTNFGLSYTHNRRIESIYTNTYGNVNTNYLMFIDFGAFYGRTELLDDSKFLSYQATTPLVNNSNKFGLQYFIQLNKNISLNNEIAYQTVNGYYGTKGSASIVFTSNTAKSYFYNGNLQIKKDKTLHNINLELKYSELSNNENKYSISKNPGDTQSIIYYGDNNVLDKNLFSASLNYDILFNKKVNSFYKFNLGGNYFMMNQQVSQFPYFRTQDITSFQIKSSLLKSLTLKNKNVLEIETEIGYSSGFGTAYKNGLYTTSNGSGPVSSDINLFKEFEYLTSPAISAKIGIGYQLELNKGYKPFIKLEDGFKQAFETNFIGKNYNSFSFSIGCNF